jgi:hypothetical protein
VGGTWGQTTWQDWGVAVRIILKLNFNKLDETERVLRLDKVRWRAVVKTVTNPRVPQNAGNFLTTRGTISSSIWILFHVVSYFDRQYSKQISSSKWSPTCHLLPSVCTCNDNHYTQQHQNGVARFRKTYFWHVNRYSRFV